MLTEWAGWEWVLFVNVADRRLHRLAGAQRLVESQAGRRASAPSTSPARSPSPPAWRCSSTRWSTPPRRLDLDRDDPAHRRRPRPARRLRRHRAADEAAAGAVLDLPPAHPAGSQPRRDPDRDVAVLDVLPDHPLPAAGARRRRPRSRVLLPAAGALDHRRRRRRRRPGDQSRLQAGADRRDGAGRGGARLVHPGQPRTARSWSTSSAPRSSPASVSGSPSSR